MRIVSRDSAFNALRECSPDARGNHHMAHPLSFMFDSERATAADVWVKIQALNPSVHRGILIDVMLEWARDKMQQGNPFASVYVDFCHAEIARQAASVTG